jgi:hypothetical protein
MGGVEEGGGGSGEEEKKNTSLSLATISRRGLT